MKLDVAARIDGAFVAQMIDEGLLSRTLVDVAHERISAQSDLADVGAVEHDAQAARVQAAPRRPLRGEPWIGDEDAPLALNLLGRSGRGRCRARRRCSRRRARRASEHELATASFRHPDARVVVSPRSPQQACTRTYRPAQRDPAGDIGLALIARAAARFADEALHVAGRRSRRSARGAESCTGDSDGARNHHSNPSCVVEHFRRSSLSGRAPSFHASTTQLMSIATSLWHSQVRTDCRRAHSRCPRSPSARARCCRRHRAAAR